MSLANQYNTNSDNNNNNNDSNKHINCSENINSRNSRPQVLRSFGVFDNEFIDEEDIDIASFYRARDK